MDKHSSKEVEIRFELFKLFYQETTDYYVSMRTMEATFRDLEFGFVDDEPKEE
jgi:hypothetical protein